MSEDKPETPASQAQPQKPPPTLRDHVAAGAVSVTEATLKVALVASVSPSSAFSKSRDELDGDKT